MDEMRKQLSVPVSLMLVVIGVRSHLLRLSLERMELEWRCFIGIYLSRHALPGTDNGDCGLHPERLGYGKFSERSAGWSKQRPASADNVIQHDGDRRPNLTADYTDHTDFH